MDPKAALTFEEAVESVYAGEKYNETEVSKSVWEETRRAFPDQNGIEHLVWLIQDNP